MESKEPAKPNRGRARGRSRGVVTGQQGADQQPGRAAQQPRQTAQQPGQGAQQQGQGAQQPGQGAQQHGQGAQQSGEKAQQTSSRNMRRHAPTGGQQQLRQVGEEQQLVQGLSSVDIGNNGNNGSASAGRASFRGKRTISDGKIYRTKPENVTSKMGCGEKINITANYYEFKKNAKWELAQYHVDFVPDIENSRDRKLLLKEHIKKFKNKYVFDGTSLFTTHHFPNKETNIRWKDNDNVYSIKITRIKNLHHFDIMYIQILNIILRDCQQKLGLTLLGRNYYDAKAAFDVPAHNISIWPGFTTSIRHHEETILMNVDVSHKIIRRETVYDVMSEIRNHAGGKPDFDILVGSIVMTKYNNKTYSISAIAINLSPSSKFKIKEGEEKSYNAYYQEKYRIKIKDQNQPLLISLPKERDRRRGDNNDIILVPELCYMTGISENLKSNFRAMKEIGEFTKPDPRARVASLNNFNQRLRTHPEVIEVFKEWELELSPRLVDVNCHITQPENILQGPLNDRNRQFSYNRAEADWTRDSRGKKLNEPISLKKWKLIYLKRGEADAREFVKELTFVGPAMGMMIAQPDVQPLSDDRIGSYVAIMKNCKEYELVMAILPNNRSDRYGALKKEMCNNLGIPSQFMLARTIGKPGKRSIATKVAIQINCKLGGEPWNVEMPLKAMFVGFDTHHHSRMKGSSFGATVASFNRNGTKYFGTVNQHQNHEELSSNFYLSMKACLDNFYRINGEYPPTIVIFRDGVGDSQIEYVKEIELASIKEQLNTNYKDKRPNIVFIVVSKRINTRIFKMMNGTPKNPPPGTVCDNVITLPERYDFFMVSQAVRQGTVSPTSYNIIENETRLTADQLQRISYKMCHLYYNWQGTVALPAPSMYAHKLALISGTATHEKVHSNLENKLWFL